MRARQIDQAHDVYSDLLDAAERAAGTSGRDVAHDAAHDAIVAALERGESLDALDVDAIARNVASTLRTSRRRVETIRRVLSDGTRAPRSDMRRARDFGDVSELTDDDACRVAESLAFSTFGDVATFAPSAGGHSARQSPRISVERRTVGEHVEYVGTSERVPTFHVAGVEYVDTRTPAERADHARAVIVATAGVDVRRVRDVSRTPTENVREGTGRHAATERTSWQTTLDAARRGDVARDVLAPIDTRTPAVLAEIIRANAWRGNPTFAALHAYNVERVIDHTGTRAPMVYAATFAAWHVDRSAAALCRGVADVLDALAWHALDADDTSTQHVDAVTYTAGTWTRVDVATRAGTTRGTDHAPVTIGPRIRHRESGNVFTSNADGWTVGTWNVAHARSADVDARNALRANVLDYLGTCRPNVRRGGRGRPTVDVFGTLDTWARSLDVFGIGDVDARLTLAPAGVSTLDVGDVLTMLANDPYVFDARRDVERRNVSGLNVSALVDAYNATRGTLPALARRTVADAITAWRAHVLDVLDGVDVDVRPRAHVDARTRALAAVTRAITRRVPARYTLRATDRHARTDDYYVATFHDVRTCDVSHVERATVRADDGTVIVPARRTRGKHVHVTPIGTRRGNRAGVAIVDLPRSASAHVPADRWSIAWRVEYGHDASRIAARADFHDVRGRDVLDALDVPATWEYVPTDDALALRVESKDWGAE